MIVGTHTPQKYAILTVQRIIGFDDIALLHCIRFYS